MVRRCPKCESLLVASYGEPSPIDGWRDYVCLACETELQRYRFRPLLLTFGILAAITLPFMLALGVWIISEWLYRVLIAPFFVALCCAQTLRYVFRTSRKPATTKLDTSQYPNTRVRLTNLDIAVTEALSVESERIHLLEDFVLKAIGVAGECFQHEASDYWVSARVTLAPRGREVVVGYRLTFWADKAGTNTTAPRGSEVVVGYRGQPSNTEQLGTMFAALEALPSVAILKGQLEIEFWFWVHQ